ncbi:MAG: RsmB/NOP family class I SAM-dependent RNA methyltransferase [Paracoccaceae bacterium]
MTPAARVAAAIDILDSYLGGLPLEKVLTGWGRSNRYAGSGDRAAIRDHVFEAVRSRRSYAFTGGAETGRGLMLGYCRAQGIDLASVFTGAKYAPAALEESEQAIHDISGETNAVQLDCPDWLLPKFEETLADDTLSVLKLLQSRAPVFLRVNTARADIATATASLALEEILTEPHDLSPTALQVLQNPRRVQRSEAYTDGLVELQDVASQAVVDHLPLNSETEVLDYCAGGGGKGLAIAARGVKSIAAYDALPQRMIDLPTRAERAGAAIGIVTSEQLVDKTYNLVVCDVPCSGSGSWRRSPESKWALNEERLAELNELQAEILDNAQAFVSNNGKLAYITCSLFKVENRQQIDGFLSRHPGWAVSEEHRFSPLQGGDGFYLAILTRE